MTGRAKPGTARRALDDAMSEDDLMYAVLDLAQQGGWLAFHAKPASVMQRGRYVRLTHQQGSMGFPDPKYRVKGFWDVTLLRDHEILCRELKTEDGTLTDEQKVWLAHAGELGGVWRPRDLPLIRRTLLAPRGPNRVDVAVPRSRQAAARIAQQNSVTRRATGFDE